MYRALILLPLILFLAACDAPDSTESTVPEPAVADPSPEPPTDPSRSPPDVAAPPEDATTTDSGLAYRRLVEGPKDGPLVTASDTVTVHYTGWRAEDGEMFDSSVVRGEPATFPVRGVIAGWTEALQLMRPGDTIRVWIPGSLAYDNSTRPGAPKGMLVFDIALLGINPAQ
ncbi:MAG: FKBP-type peptidyl-prolyl cis-trans isomerase [Gammaproteobacteria bacterium]